MFKRKKSDGHYHISELEKRYPDALYYMVYGEKSNGKTYTILEKILNNYVKTGEQGAVIRRWDTDFKGQTAKTMYNSFVDDGKGRNIVKELTDGRFDDIRYYNGTWTLIKHDYDDEPGQIFKDQEPFCYAFSLNGVEHMNGSSYLGITTVLFDEFMSRRGYLPDEFVLFETALSNIIRDRDNVKIYMMGNSVNKSCPYFREMGLNHITEMKQGDTALYTYGEDGKTTVAVEHAGTAIKNGGKKSDKYFAFDNPALDMITQGDWQIKVYPHKPIPFDREDIKFTYFIQFEDQILQCEIIMKGHYNFTFVHPKTTPLRHMEKDLIFSQEASPLFNFSRKINQGMNKQKLVGKILQYYNNEKIFYSDNSTGEIMRNYIMWCKRANVLS